MSTQKNEHNPDNLTPEQYGPPEWRLLFSDESIQDGDEVWLPSWGGNGKWDRLDIFNDTPKGLHITATYRRRITPPTDTTGSGREGETPDTDRATKYQVRVYSHQNGTIETVRVELAKQLERQRDAALAQVEALRRKVAEQERELMDHAEDWAFSGIMPGSKLAGKLAEHDRKRKQEREDSVLLDLLEQLATIRWPFGNTAMLAASVEAKEPFTEKPTVRAILRAAIDSAQRQEGR